MSTLSRKKFPDIQDLVIGTVTKIQKHGVYISLKEYGDIEGYCHISEVAGAWIRNIRNFVRIDQQVVAKVLRVDEETGQIDISLKRVSDQARKEKIQEIKRQNASLAMINLIAEKLNKNTDEIRDLIEDELVRLYGSLYVAFEELAAIGLEAIEDVDIPNDIKNVMHEVAEMSIQINTVSITSDLGIRSFASDGVDQVMKLLKVAEETANSFPEISHELTSIGAPKYRLYLEGRSYPEVTEVFDKISEALKNASKKLNVEYKIEKKDNK